MRLHRIAGPLVAVAALFAATAAVGEKSDSQASYEVHKAKQTSLGLYVTSTEAHEKWKAAPEKVKILDVRSPGEYIFIGHAEMAWNIPFAFQTYQWDAGKQRFAMEPNPDFVSQVEEWAKPADTILVMCRSGGRSAMAVNLLAEAGFTNVYNIIDGMEGDKVDDPGSLFYGKRMKNGWKNSGLPWTYDLNPEWMSLPKRQETSDGP
jgi:rhodanese-related sulfurtransferase